MDKFTGAFNSFAGGDNNNNNRQQGQGQGQYSQGQEQGGIQGGFPEGNQQSQQSHNNNGGGSAGDFLGGLGFGGGNNQQGQQGYQGQGQNQGQSSSGGGFLGGLGDKFNSAAGGGRESEKNEDYLDKAIDMAQEKFLGQGPQDNESAIEQAKDEQISDYIRKQYKSTTGTDFPIKDKETRFG